GASPQRSPQPERTAACETGAGTRCTNQGQAIARDRPWENTDAGAGCKPARRGKPPRTTWPARAGCPCNESALCRAWRDLRTGRTDSSDGAWPRFDSTRCAGYACPELVEGLSVNGDQ